MTLHRILAGIALGSAISCASPTPHAPEARGHLGAGDPGAHRDREPRLVGTLPPSFTRPHLARLRRHVAVLLDVNPYDATERASLLLFDGEQLLRDEPIELPPEASGTLSIAGDWPRFVDLVAVGRVNVAEATLGTLGYERIDGAWRQRDIGCCVATLGVGTVSASRDARASEPIRWVRGPVRPFPSPAPASAGCAESERRFALTPHQIAAVGPDRLAVLGSTCDGTVGVEVYTPPSKGTHLQTFPSLTQELGGEGGNVQLVSRDGALWLISFRSLFRYEGGEWQPIPPPSAAADITDGALGADGSLWLCDRGKLLRRSDDGSYQAVDGLESHGPVVEIETAPSGFLVLAGDALYALGEGR